LQGERRGQEGLKNNLIRRIKMLEVALKQERVKYHKLKYGTEPIESKSLSLNTAANADNNGKTKHAVVHYKWWCSIMIQTY
jgi:hypothetical protein